MEWTSRERELFRELKAAEEASIRGYGEDELRTTDPELKKLFAKIRQEEETHLKTLKELEQGIIPMAAGGKKAGGEGQATGGKKEEEDLNFCRDALEAEQRVSSQYDKAIFAFRDCSVREILNHIQKEEQEHGRMLAAYMDWKQMQQ